MRSIGRLFFLVVVGTLLFLSGYALPEFEQALVVQMGSVRGAPVTQAGLHWHVPFLENVLFFDKRILQWDSQRDEIPTRDQKFIWVDATARWRIKDALAFYKSLHDVPTALSRMGAILNGVTKDTISSHDLIEVVRNSNQIVSDRDARLAAAQKAAPGPEAGGESSLDELDNDLEKVQIGREKLSSMIADRARPELTPLGLELIDVQLRSIAYKEVVEQKVFARMVSERQKIAAKILSSGKAEEARILGQLELAQKKVSSESYRQSALIRGRAEAEAIGLIASVVKGDADFYEFSQSLDAYRNALGSGKAQLLLSTDSAFLKVLRDGK
jgi:membrane protease subunit HflC